MYRTFTTLELLEQFLYYRKQLFLMEQTAYSWKENGFLFDLSFIGLLLDVIPGKLEKKLEEDSSRLECVENLEQLYLPGFGISQARLELTY